MFCIGSRPRDHHQEHRLEICFRMVVWKCLAKNWGESYGRFTVRVGGMSRKVSKFISTDSIVMWAGAAIALRETLRVHSCHSLPMRRVGAATQSVIPSALSFTEPVHVFFGVLSGYCADALGRCT